MEEHAATSSRSLSAALAVRHVVSRVRAAGVGFEPEDVEEDLAGVLAEYGLGDVDLDAVTLARVGGELCELAEDADLAESVRLTQREVEAHPAGRGGSPTAALGRVRHRQALRALRAAAAAGGLHLPRRVSLPLGPLLEDVRAAERRSEEW